MNHRILVVDDESRMRKLVRDFLQKKGYDVIEAENGEQAVDIFCSDNMISLIILDVMMPKMDGWLPVSNRLRLTKKTFTAGHIANSQTTSNSS